jgi:hypothetical protein
VNVLAVGTIPSLTVYDDGSSDFRLPGDELLPILSDALNDPEVSVGFMLFTVPKEKRA